MLEVIVAGLSRRVRPIAALAAMAIWVGSAPAQNVEGPRVHFNQTWIEEATRAHKLDLTDPMVVFAHVFRSLPDRVRVYPTENYYYFSFVANGNAYHGSIRLEPLHRDQGKLDFGYFDGLSEWRPDWDLNHFLVLDQSHGVKLERVEPLVYRVTFGARSVVFALNDLSAVKPPPGVLHADERYLGPIFDESAIRFFFVYNPKAKVFHYILDETVPVADVLLPMKRTDRILIGRRTGFAYYRDHRLARKILIGVHRSNALVNNYFDGPFDQLPENFIVGEELREAIVHADPSVKGKIGRLGHFIGAEGRYLIDPYMTYSKDSELVRVHACATAKTKRPAEYPRCFHNPTVIS